MVAAAAGLLLPVLMGQNPLGGLLKHWLPGPTPEFLIQSGVRPENLISNNFPGDADTDTAKPGMLP